jgi:hypothetical protein
MNLHPNIVKKLKEVVDEIPEPLTKREKRYYLLITHMEWSSFVSTTSLDVLSDLYDWELDNWKENTEGQRILILAGDRI